MLKTYDNRDKLMNSLADRVAAELRAAIAENGSATLSVPGGTTPQPFFHALRGLTLDWAAVTICLNDERIVDESSDRSNTRLIKDHLIQDKAAEASFLNILDEDAPIDECLPIDVLVVGMGGDMHTASLFPDAPDLASALADDAPAIMPIQSANSGEERITFTAPVLRNAKYKHVLITGEAKLKVYKDALNRQSELKAPIRTVLTADPAAIVHHAE